MDQERKSFSGGGIGDAQLGELQKVSHEEQSPRATSQPEDEVARIVKETLDALDSRKNVVDEHAQRQREQIVRALTDSKGQVAGEDGTAARLGINRTTLLSRMKKFGISAKQFS